VSGLFAYAKNQLYFRYFCVKLAMSSEDVSLNKRPGLSTIIHAVTKLLCFINVASIANFIYYRDISVPPNDYCRTKYNTFSKQANIYAGHRFSVKCEVSYISRFQSLERTERFTFYSWADRFSQFIWKGFNLASIIPRRLFENKYRPLSACVK